jgi:hypothetical protein
VWRGCTGASAAAGRLASAGLEENPTCWSLLTRDLGCQTGAGRCTPSTDIRTLSPLPLLLLADR